MAECPGRFVLVQRFAADLTAVAQETIDRHLEGCPACQRRYAAIRANAEAYEQVRVAALHRLSDQLDAPPVAPSTRRPRWLAPLAGLGLAAAASVVIVLVIAQPAQHGTVAYKGAQSWQVIARRDETQFVLSGGERLRAGDALRFVLTTDGPGHAEVLSLTASGVLTPLYPQSPPDEAPSPWPIAGAGRHTLPDSIVLDDFVGTEYLVMAFAPTPFSRAELHALLQDHLPSDSFPRQLAGADVRVLVIEKTP